MKNIHDKLESQVSNHKTIHRWFSCGTHTLQHRCRLILRHLPRYLVLDNCFGLDIFTSLFVDYEFRNFNVNLKLVFDLYRVQVNIWLTSLIETFIKVWNSNLIIIFLESISNITIIKNECLVLLVTFQWEMLRLLGSESIPGNTLIPRTFVSIAEMFGIGYISLLNNNVAIPSLVIDESMTAS